MRQLENWLLDKISDGFSLTPLPGDAGFRRYYRVILKNDAHQTYIAVFSPPATENNADFLKISRIFAKLGLHVPTVIAYDLEQGFLLLTDLGDQLLLTISCPDNKSYINNQNINNLYQKALDSLGKIQTCKETLPAFDAVFMRNELACFEEWFLDKHLRLVLSKNTQKMLHQAFDVLVMSAVSQPQCCIHRDYHSRNIMILPDRTIGILDFQDAMQGPVTYDLASLIRDCYVSFSASQVEQWAFNFYQKFLKQFIPSQAEFVRYFDLMGIQRHLKAIFIFARKFHRDGASGYLKDIPRALNYIQEVSQAYPELKYFRTLMADITL